MASDRSIKNLYASTRRPESNTGNLGDIFGYILAEKITQKSLNRKGIDDKKNIDGQTLLLVGSILNHIKPHQNALTYGPGFITSNDNPKNLKGNRIAGVRGKLSKKMIEEAFPNQKVRVCSDPGLLMKSMCAPDFEVAKEINLGAIVHSVDRAQYSMSSFNHIPIVEHYKGLDLFLKSISSYTHLITTSLHGMIFCHSLGIPVLPVAISNKITGGSFKFNDYLSSVKLPHRKNLRMLHQIPRQNNKIIELIAESPQPSSDLIADISQKQLRQIRRLIRNPSAIHCL